MYHDWNNRSSVIMYQFSLLCSYGSDEVSSCDVSLGLFDRGLLGVGILRVAGVHFDVSGDGLLLTSSRLLTPVMLFSFLLHSTLRSLTGGSECCGWLQFMTRGRGLWLLQSADKSAPSSSAREVGWHVSELCTLGRDHLQLRR